jgi:hypothetical protein
VERVRFKATQIRARCRAAWGRWSNQARNTCSGHERCSHTSEQSTVREPSNWTPTSYRCVASVTAQGQRWGLQVAGLHDYSERLHEN